MPKKVTVVCDNESCDWFREKQNPIKWIDKPCPVCGHEYIIDSLDFAIYRFYNIAEFISKVYCFLNPWAKTTDVLINTAELKQESKITNKGVI